MYDIYINPKIIKHFFSFLIIIIFTRLDVATIIDKITHAAFATSKIINIHYGLLCCVCSSRLKLTFKC
ncbi:TPA: hypothetical protein MIB75_26600 [Klebsiella pneumoniae]|nr:hypothetical protein [Klebsiella pneumoniae]